jgi:hypothetical protein
MKSSRGTPGQPLPVHDGVEASSHRNSMRDFFLFAWEGKEAHAGGQFSAPSARGPLSPSPLRVVASDW